MHTRTVKSNQSEPELESVEEKLEGGQNYLVQEGVESDGPLQAVACGSEPLREVLQLSPEGVNFDLVVVELG